ncbi:MAG: hypothetical protein ACLGJB_12205 [Blastocatellia bacterium]
MGKKAGRRIKPGDRPNREVFVVHKDNLMYSDVDSSAQSVEPAMG